MCSADGEHNNDEERRNDNLFTNEYRKLLKK